MSFIRNYGQEYKKYQQNKVQKKKRASRNAARNVMIKAGFVRKGDGKDVSHLNGNPFDNRRSNLIVEKPSRNRSFARTRNAKKRNPYA